MSELINQNLDNTDNAENTEQIICNCCEQTTDDYTIVDDDIVCCDCLSDNYCTCECCECYHRTDDIITDGNTYLCNSCYNEHYSRCDSCSNIIHDDDRYSLDCNNDYYCTNCYQDHYCECSDCNPDLESETANITQHNHNILNYGSRYILDYHADIDWEFKSKKTDCDSYHIGLELEIECGENSSKSQAMQDTVKHLFGNCVIMEDGSLSNGFEIITTPHKYSSLRELKLKELTKILKSNNMKSHDSKTCGFHIHISKSNKMKKYLDDRYNADKFKVLNNFQYRVIDGSNVIQSLFNRLNYCDFITRLSKRTNEQIKRYCDFKYSNTDRYTALNISNYNTIEFRIWNGSLNYERLLANLQFSIAIVEFYESYSNYFLLNSDNSRLFLEFIKFLKQSNRYNHLVKYLKTNNLI